MKTLLLILLLIPNLIFGQLATNTSLSPPGLVQNVLLGTGVVVSNINYTGNLQAIGEFTANGTNLGINHGIIITTGTVFNNGNGPQGPNDNGGSGIDNGAGESTILNGILGSSNTFNASVLEFDFVAQGDEVRFNYVFGSEEYLEYVNAGFNDVFGLFISGPGISGNQNIAKLPNQTIVSIDNVNNLVNSAFYVDNGDGSESPYNSSNIYIQYDGYTKVLTAHSAVQCGQTYHLTIAIADVGDGILDSGIFLEAESLVSEPSTSIDFEISQNFFGNDSILAEGCTSGDFIFNRLNTDEPLNVPITVTGTAENGIDFTNTIPTNLNLATGQSSATFTFDALVDGLVEDIETIIVTFQIPDICNGTTTKTFTIQIKDVEPISVSIEDDTIFCDGVQSITLTPIVTGGLAPITYLWSTNQTSPTITVSPNTTTTYTVTATDFCLNSNDTDDAEIYIPPLIPIVIQPIANINENCPFIPHLIVPEVSGGNGSQYFYQWSSNGQNLGNGSSITLNPSQTADYQLNVTDACGGNASTEFSYTVNTILLIPEINSPELICPGDSVLLKASATLGYGAYSYQWNHSSETTANVWVNPLITTTYTVNISDECQTYSVPISTTVPVHQPHANFSFSSRNLEMNIPIQFNNLTNNGVSYSWDLGNGFLSSEENPVTSYPDIGSYEVTLIAVDNIGCIDTITKTINIGYTLYIPNTFTPNEDRLNNKFFARSVNIDILEFQIYNRWGQLVFESKNDTDFQWDGTYNKKICPDGIYTYKILYKTISSNEELTKTGHIALLK